VIGCINIKDDLLIEEEWWLYRGTF
jgi:hypothetical protein